MHSLLPKGIKLNNFPLSEKKNQWRKISVHRVIQNLILFCMKNKNKFGFITSKNLWNFALIYFLSIPSTTCWGCSIHVLIKRLNYTGSLSLRAHENKYLLKSLRCGIQSMIQMNLFVRRKHTPDRKQACGSKGEGGRAGIN